MRTIPVTRRSVPFFLVSGLLLFGFGCGGSPAEMEKARQAEAEASKRLRECEEELAQTRKALEAARHRSATSGEAEGAESAAWQAARRTAEAFLDAVNSRNADAANVVGTREFQRKNGGTNAINLFANGRFRGDAKGYTCALPNRLEAVPGKDEFVARGGLLYRRVPRQDSTYTLHIVKEGDNWRVASFTAVER